VNVNQKISSNPAKKELARIQKKQGGAYRDRRGTYANKFVGPSKGWSSNCWEAGNNLLLKGRKT